MAYNEYILWPTEIITPRDEFQAYFTASTLTITDPDVEEDDSAVWMQFAMAIVILLSV